MVPVDAIVAALRDDSVLTAIAVGGIHDHDLRRTGESFLTSTYGDMLPSVIVDDQGGGRDPFSRASALFSDRVALWFFAPMNLSGRIAVEAMTARALAVLHRWQDPETGTVVMQGDRLGVQVTDSPDQSYMDRLTLKCQGVHKAVAW